jgi:hypothetical protein
MSFVIIIKTAINSLFAAITIPKFRVDNVRHTSAYFFFENFIMAEIVQPSDKMKLIFILF